MTAASASVSASKLNFSIFRISLSPEFGQKNAAGHSFAQILEKVKCEISRNLILTLTPRRWPQSSVRHLFTSG
jgi:hypothetical protein